MFRFGKLFLLVCVFSATASAQSWQWQNPLPQGNTLNDVTFADESNGWAVGNWGTILRTTDGGDSWALVSSGTTEQLIAVAFFTEVYGWIVGGGGTILRTSDGGNTWWPQTIESASPLRDIAMISDLEAWAVGDHVYHTTNGGLNWIEQTVPGDSLRMKVVFSDVQHGWILSGQQSVVRTTDGGGTWTTHTVRDSASLSSMDFVDNENGWVAGSHPQVGTCSFRTEDGGLSWITLSGNTTDRLKHIDFVDTARGWGVGGFMFPSLSRTSNGGASWLDSMFFWQEGRLHGIFNWESGDGWAVGTWGLMLRSTDGGNGWQHGSNHIVGSGVHCVAFANADTGIVIDYEPIESGPLTKVLRTTNGGVCWQIADTLPGYYSYRVALTSSGRGCGIGAEGEIVATTDYGMTWTVRTNPAGVGLEDVEYADDLHAWAVGDNTEHAVLLHTTDGGLSWTVQREDSHATIDGMDVVDAQTLWLIERNYPLSEFFLMRSTDGGESWQPRVYPDVLVHCCPGLSFIDSLHGWMAVDRSPFVGAETTDGGLTWHEWNYSFVEMSFADSLYGLAFGNEGVIRTVDGGWTWEPIASPVSPASILDIDLITPTRGWIVSSYGILRYDGTLAPVTPEPEPALPADFNLSAFPNPFNPTTTISFILPAPGPLRLAVYDLTGRLVEILVDDLLAAGRHEVVFDGAGLASGIYFARISAGAATQAQKLVLLK